MEPRQLRDKANEALAKGRFPRAAELFEEYCQLEPKDFQTRLRLGDTWAKAGNKPRAITAYQAAAEGFAHEGFLPRAIAASKLILELDPSHQGVQQMLAGLYARKGGAGGSARALTPKPVAPAPAPEKPAEAPPFRAALHIDLPPEVDDALADDEPAPPEAEAASPGVEVELELEEPGTEPSPGVEVELDLSDAERGTPEPSVEPEAAPPPLPVAQAVPPPFTATQAAPPGLRPRGTSAPRPPEPEPVAAQPVTPAAPRPSFPVAPPSPRLERFAPDADVDYQPPVPGNTPFTEFAVGADSLLHAVEMAALAGVDHHAEPAPVEVEEPIAEAPPAEGALPQIPLFSDLPRDAFIALFERCPLRRFPEGSLIIEQGSRGDAFYVICAGKVRVVRQTGAEQRELSMLGEGAFFGEMALLSGAPRSASVVSAAEETQLLEISAPVLAELSRRHPQVAKALRRFCRQRLLSDVVNTSAIFQPFGRKDRRELVERFRAREVRRNEVIIHEGQTVDGLYVVLSGEVAVSKGGTALAQLHEGELFGEMSLLQKTPATATVTAVRNTSLLRLPREDFDTLILTHPQILALVSDLTESRQRSNDEALGVARDTKPADGESLESFDDLILF